MEETTKKSIAKRIILWVVGVIAFLTLAIAVMVNFILTPENLTPLVRDVARQYLDAEVDVERVDAVFFSSFPRAGVRIRGLQVVSHKLKAGRPDSIPHSRRDTLLLVDEAHVGIDLGRLVRTGELNVRRLGLKHPQIRLWTDSLGNKNWDIMRTAADILVADTVAADTAATLPVSLKNIKIEDARITFGNRTNQSYFRTSGLNVEVKGDINLKNLDVDVKLNNKSTYFALEGTRYLRRLPLGFDGHVTYDLETGCYVLDKTKLTVAETELNLDGWVCPDSLGANEADIDLRFSLATPDATQLFDYLPKDFIQKEINIEQGSMLLNGSFVGRRSAEEKPVLACTIEVGGVKAHYEGMPHGIDDLSAKFDALIDAQKPDSSYVNLDIFHFKGGKSEVEATVRMASALADPRINCKVRADLDLLSLTEVFPVENTKMKGRITANVEGDFRLADARNLDLAKLRLKGQLGIDSLNLQNDSLGISVRTNSNLRFETTDMLSIHADIERLRLRTPDKRISMRDLVFDGRTEAQRDTTRLATILARCTGRRLMMRFDSTRVFLRHFEAEPVLTHSARDKRQPSISLRLKSDTITARHIADQAFLTKLAVRLALEKQDTTWTSLGTIDFGEAKIQLPMYQLPIELSDVRFLHKKRTINIEKMHVRAGRSTANITGSVRNLYGALYEGKRLSTKLNVAADTLNFNELVGAVVPEEMRLAANDIESDSDSLSVNISTPTHSVETDSIPSRLIILPPKLRVAFGLTAKHLIWNKLNFNNVRSNVEVRRQALHLTNFTFDQGRAHTIITMAYKPRPQGEAADVKCFMRWERADIAHLVRSLDLDTILPVLSPLRGELDCYLAAEVEVDTAWNFDLSRSRAAAHLSGKQMTVMDTENFAKISKVLMFKNKKENVIDTVSLNVLIENGKVEILPFVANVDRYRAVIGGTQDFDMNLDYHVSIIKSPLPFKAGVNLTGTTDNLAIDVTRAKLKGYNNTEAQLHNDTVSLSVRMDILRKSYLLSGIEMPEQLKREGDTAIVRPRRNRPTTDTATDSIAAIKLLVGLDSVFK